MKTRLGSYEAILQLRPENKKVLDFIKKQISKRKDVSIINEIPLKTGIDLYLNSKRFAISVGRKLKKVFRGDLKISRKLYGLDKQRSKKIYRVTVCFRLK